MSENPLLEYLKAEKAAEEPPVPQSKKPFLIMLVLMLLIALAGAITVFLLVRPDKVHVPSESIDQKPEIDYTYGLTDKYETYNLNSLSFDYKETKIQGIAVSYYVISGLKDRVVQDKINKDIYNTVNEAANKAKIIINKDEEDDEEYSNPGIEYSLTGNFNNILSFALYGQDVDNFVPQGLNYDLRTGEVITLDQVFVDNFDPQPVIAQMIYEELSFSAALDKAYMAEFKDEVFTGSLVEDIESDTFRLINEYRKGNYSFYITIEGLSFNLKNGYYQQFETKFVDNAPAYALFKRFLTAESLFEKQLDIPKDIPIGLLPRRLEGDGMVYDGLFGKVFDNAFVDVKIYDLYSDDDGYDNENSQSKIPVDQLGIIIQGAKEYLKKYCADLKGSSALILGDMYITKSLWDKYYLVAKPSIATMDNDYFAEIYPHKIIDTLRDEPVGGFETSLFEQLNKKKIKIVYNAYDFDESTAGEYFFNLKGERVTNLKFSDIFKAKVDVKSVFVNRPDFYKKYQDQPDLLDQIFKEATYKIFPYHVTFQHSKYGSCTIDLDDIDESYYQ